MSGYDCPEWEDIARGLRQGQLSVDDSMPGVHKGWQRGVATHVDEAFRAGVVWPRLHSHEQALFRSQSGPMAGAPFSSIPWSSVTRFEPQEFRVLLLRRLWCPLPLSASKLPVWPSPRSKWPPPRSLSAHRSLGRRGFPLESAAARVWREAGGRVTTNVRVQDLDLPPRAGADNRRLEVVADGLSLFHGARGKGRVCRDSSGVGKSDPRDLRSRGAQERFKPRVWS